MRLFKRGKHVEPEGPVPEAWQLSEGSDAGKRLIARFNAGARGLAGSPRYSIQIGVAVPLLAPDAEGMPGGNESAQLGDFEDAIVERAAGKAVFVGVITTGGMREFVLYTGSGDWIPAFHEDLRAALPDHDVQVIAQTDPKWSVYRQFVRT